MNAQQLVASLGLQPHPEGGFYKETYRATRVVDVDGRVRAASTAIYFLLTTGTFSALHRIRSDEVWHFYAGADLEVVSFDEQGRLLRERVGASAATGAVPQLVVPAGRWFGSRLADDGDADAFALVGCTVAPGFDFADFELGTREELLRQFPSHVDVVTALTRA
ncbi:MAG: cupin domain-containing protein [Deltaproteobacteria bacterium]|nr:cupin domain-containing protein [Deltaproteobacteria bacterium]